MKKLILVIELEVPEDYSPVTCINKFPEHMTAWSSYEPKEGDDPIRLNISYYDGVEEV